MLLLEEGRRDVGYAKEQTHFSFLTPERVHRTQLPSRQVNPLFLCHVLHLVLWPQFEDSSSNKLTRSLAVCRTAPIASRSCCQLPLVLFLSSVATLPNVLPPPHDCLLNFRRQLTIKNDYGEIKSRQSFVGRNIFSHLPTCNIK